MTKRLTAIILSLSIMLICAAAYADTALDVQTDRAEVSAGDTVEITITLKGDKLSAAEGNFAYDTSLLSFDGAEGGAGDGYISMVSLSKGGESSLSARIRFKALAEGNAEVVFSMTKILNYGGKEQGTAESKAAVKILPGPEPTPTPEPISYAKEGVKAHNVKGAEGDMYVWRSIENVTVPSRYTESEYTYHGEAVAAAEVADSDAPLLLYVTDDTGAIGGYHIYDEANDTLYPYKTVSSASRSYIILEPDEGVSIPAGFAETTLSIDETEYRAWVSNDAQGEIYLLYARNPKGETGFYTYSVEDSSMQRYAVMPARPVMDGAAPDDAAAPATPAPAPDEGADADSAKGADNTLLYIMIAVAVLLAAALIYVILHHRREEQKRRERIARRRAEREGSVKAE